MAHLIDKSALLAEIERRLNYRVESLKAINNGTFWDKDQSEDEFNKSLTRCAFNAAKNELFELKCFLNTLEVKEVNLEKEIKEEYLKRRHYAGKVNLLVLLNASQFNDIAKHFLELGVKIAQKGE